MRLYENSNLGEILKNVRLECKLSQEKLAESIGYSRKTISRIENGQEEAKYKIFYRWLNACGKQLIVRSYKKETNEIPIITDNCLKADDFC